MVKGQFDRAQCVLIKMLLSGEQSIGYLTGRLIEQVVNGVEEQDGSALQVARGYLDALISEVDAKNKARERGYR